MQAAPCTSATSTSRSSDGELTQWFTKFAGAALMASMAMTNVFPSVEYRPALERSHASYLGCSQGLPDIMWEDAA